MKINSVTSTLVTFAMVSSAAAKWARFRSDGGCEGDNLGQVSINDQGCMFVPNATSIRIDRASDFTKKRCLVMSKGDNCECQSGSIPFTATGQCMWLDNTRYKSYKFMEQDCGEDECAI